MQVANLPALGVALAAAPVQDKCCSCMSLQGVRDYESTVIHQLMNLMYRYTSDILQDADVSSCPACCLLHSLAKPCSAYDSCDEIAELPWQTVLLLHSGKTMLLV